MIYKIAANIIIFFAVYITIVLDILAYSDAYSSNAFIKIRHDFKGYVLIHLWLAW